VFFCCSNCSCSSGGDGVDNDAVDRVVGVLNRGDCRKEC
jgi:hypothetical protein